MTYFKTKDIAAITVFAALWGVLNSLISPIFFRMFNLPFMCDLIGFSSLILATWYVKRPGTATTVGIIATLINFILLPSATHFLGFTAASAVFDFFTFMVGYKRIFKINFLGSITLFTISVISAAFAGVIIALFFMTPVALNKWGGVVGWAALHAIGGVLGGTLGIILMNALTLRGIQNAAD
ncbi:MAG: hypothetical protein QW279_08905 [Candidatus Jordarchaeaceae archaeon]